MSTIKEHVAKLQQTLQWEDDPTVFDTEVHLHTNRGNKLKRKPEPFREGQLGGRRRYKKRIDHAGYERYVLHKNPKRYDEDGYELRSDEEDEEADVQAGARNPYYDIKIESILKPLTTASNLEHHPSLSQPYKSQVLANMTRDVCTMLHKERGTLMELKTLLTTLRGDHNWIPGGSVYSDGDLDLFAVSIKPEDVGKVLNNNGKPISVNGQLNSDKSYRDASNGDRDVMEDVGAKMSGALDTPLPTNRKGEDQTTLNLQTQHASTTQDLSDPPEGYRTWEAAEKLASLRESTSTEINLQRTNASGVDQPDGKGTGSTTPVTNASSQSRMLTRHQAQAQATAVASNSNPPSTIYPQLPSPLFVLPPKALPDRNFGLPDLEAEELRRVLTAVVQKQEEIVRGTEQLYEGLLRAKRMKEAIWRWCRAEAHIDEMSDGEDWVDLEEWGLDSMLKKGQEEGVEETASTTIGEKRPRGRRGAQ